VYDPVTEALLQRNVELDRGGIQLILLPSLFYSRGPLSSGKTTLSRFVAWMNGLHVYQIKVHNKYSMEDFDEDLRTVLRRSG
jgi:hypothetical protein